VALQRSSRLGQELLDAGVISEEQLQTAVRAQQTGGGRLGEALVRTGAITTATLLKILAARLGVKSCALRHGLIDPKVAKLITREESERMRVLPMFRVHDRLTVAMAEPQFLPVIDQLERMTSCRVNPVLALEANIAEFSAKYLAQDVNVETFLVSLTESNVEVIERESVDEGPVTDLDRMVEGSPIINLVNVAMLTAIRDGASDVHVEPDKKGTRIRYRVDGVLRELMRPPKGMHASIVSRIKVIAKLDIAERRLPQEGRIHIIAEGREIDLRVSSMPTILGEKIVMRVLDKANLNINLPALGIRQERLEQVRRMLTRPHGLLLVTGPTGSGKTTTLYSGLDLVRSGERNMVTVEDPVEYQLDMVNQIQVNDGVGLSFARALRSILRQDPDVIMVGEIRDVETARVAIQAALTGHLVLSTLHTNDSPGAVSRLMDMGIEPFLIASSLVGVIAQRLARTICPTCRRPYLPPKSLLDEAEWPADERETTQFFQGEGCRQCHDSGFRGRRGIYEILEVDAQLRGLIHHRASESELKRYLPKAGWLDLRREGMFLVRDGVSTLDEVMRVTHVEQASRDDAPATSANAPAGAATAARKQTVEV